MTAVPGEELAIEEPADFSARLLARAAGPARRHSLRQHVGRGTSPRQPRFALRSPPTFPANELRQSAQLPVLLAEHDSLPLALDIPVINKVSQNLHAEMLLRLLGREKGTGGSVAGGLEVLRQFLAQAGLQSDEYAFYDGSGLSRQNLVSPHATVRLLRYAASQPWGAEYIESLPLAGVDGTLESRLTKLSPGSNSAGQDRLAPACQCSFRISDHRPRRAPRLFHHEQQQHNLNSKSGGRHSRRNCA